MSGEAKEKEDDKVPYQYIIVRKDLPVKVQMINVGHAAGESIVDGLAFVSPGTVCAPIPATTRLVLLHVENENALLELEGIVKSKGYYCVLIREPDAPYNNAAMSLGLAPSTKRNQLRKLFYHYQAVELD